MKKYDVLIIGAGIAGLTTGIYASRANLKTAILEKGAPGGKLVNISNIENWIGDLKIQGPDLALRMWAHSKKEGVEHVYGNVISIDDKNNIVTTNVEQIEYKFLVIASGTTEKIPSEIENVEKFNQKGISYCAICDGPIYKGEEVAVIGGGNSAVEESIYLSSIVKKVKIFVRSKWNAEEKMIDDLKKKKNIEILMGIEIKKIGGDTKVEYVIDSDNKRHDVKAVFPYIGLIPNTDFLNITKIMDKHGFIKVNNLNQTKIKNIFAVGDVVIKNIRQLTTAAADGTIAAKIITNMMD